MVTITADEARFLTDISQKQLERELLENIYKEIRAAALKGENLLVVKNKYYVNTSRIEKDLKDLGFSVSDISDEYFCGLKIKW